MLILIRLMNKKKSRKNKKSYKRKKPKQSKRYLNKKIIIIVILLGFFLSQGYIFLKDYRVGTICENKCETWGQDIEKRYDEANESGIYLWDKTIIDRLIKIEDEQKLKEDMNNILQINESILQEFTTHPREDFVECICSNGIMWFIDLKTEKDLNFSQVQSRRDDYGNRSTLNLSGYLSPEGFD